MNKNVGHPVSESRYFRHIFLFIFLGLIHLHASATAFSGHSTLEAGKQSSLFSHFAPQQDNITVKGRVIDNKQQAIPGATVLIKGTTLGVSADNDGRFTLSVPKNVEAVLLVSFIGMQSKEIKYQGEEELNIVLEEDITQIDEVVVVSTGMVDLNLNTFTGSHSSYSGEKLKTISSQNVLTALKTLDPAFVITPDNSWGADPNRLPDISVRGKSSIDNLQSEYGMDPNLPIFILDDFEVSLQKILDLSMDRVANITVLKDASATAMYGSRAANGIVVIQTNRPKAGELEIRYNGSLLIDAPDLSDYNMMNAEEKLEFERLSGRFSFDGSSTESHFHLMELYNKRLLWVKSGVDTYWLSEPVRTGLTQKHTLTATGGAEKMYYSFAANYANNQGVMKKSGNQLIGFNVNLNYRTPKFSLANEIDIDYKEEENPPVAFNIYVQTNPYYTKEYSGSIPKYFDTYPLGINTYNVPNPLYNASLNYLDDRKIFSFRDNIRAEYRFSPELRFSIKLSINKSMETQEKFKSPYHTDFDQTTKLERGSYTKATTDQFGYTGDLSVTYGKLFNELHMVNLFGRIDFSSTKYKHDSFEAIGFPDDNIPNPSFANQFSTETKPLYYETLTRTLNFVAILSYSYKERYSLDVNLRRDGSTNFGKNKKYTTTYSVGIAWNLHKENFIGEWANQLKLRTSFGNPGNNNMSFYTYRSYKFNTNYQNIFGLGARVYDYGNPNLDWQKTTNWTVGADVSVLDNRWSFSFDYYRKVTDPLLVQVDVAPSTGKGEYVTNLGRSTIKGFDFKTTVNIIRKADLRVDANVTGGHNDTKFSKIGDRMNSINEDMSATSLRRYRDGGSPHDLWAVRSAGIDPISGQEMFYKKDETVTFTYDSADEVVIGNSQPTLEGTCGLSLFWRNLTFSAFFRYSFGGELFNEELYDRIENIPHNDDKTNQDKRALYDRWKNPGDITQYRDIVQPIGSNGNYPRTSRYLQKENFFTGESFNVKYDLREGKWLDKLYLRNLSLSATMNDIFRTSTVRAERGIYYPFKRTISFALSLTFK